MNYELVYNRLMTKRKKQKLDQGYTEVHHIIPRCMGGTDDDVNLVRLSAREHFIAHRLLCKMYPLNERLKFAMLYMSTSKRYGNVISSKGYESLRKEVSAARIERASDKDSIDFNFRLKIHQCITGKTRSVLKNRKRRYSKSFVRAFNLYLANLAVAKDGGFSLHLPRNDKIVPAQGSPVSLHSLLKAEKLLVELGYIESVFVDNISPLASRKRSKVTPSEKVIELLDVSWKQDGVKIEEKVAI